MKLIVVVSLAGLILLLVGCASEAQPLPGIDVAVEEKITEEITKAVDTATPLPTAGAELTGIPNTSASAITSLHPSMEDINTHNQIL